METTPLSSWQPSPVSVLVKIYGNQAKCRHCRLCAPGCGKIHHLSAWFTSFTKVSAPGIRPLPAGKIHGGYRITDMIGRPAFRIFRYPQKRNLSPRLPDASFMATNTGNSLEFIWNNLRCIQTFPSPSAMGWPGKCLHRYIFCNSELQYMDGWDYTYENAGQ